MFDGVNVATLGASSPAARIYDELQFTLGEGPCLDAVAQHSPILIDDLAACGASDPTPTYAVMLEQATRGLLELSVAVLEHLEKRIGLAPLRALQALDRRGPSLVTALGHDMDLLPSIASRLSDRLADAGLITRSVSPTNRRATMLELTDAGRSVLAELITLRTSAIRAITDQMSKDDRGAMLQGRTASLTHNAFCPTVGIPCRNRYRRHGNQQALCNCSRRFAIARLHEYYPTHRSNTWRQRRSSIHPK